jgi:ectonucleotide pyrophosphatase/phosphodiesterase family member 5
LMNGIFYAIGPSFKQGYLAPQLNNIDIYEMICKILQISPAANDGKLERIQNVLKEN